MNLLASAFDPPPKPKTSIESDMSLAEARRHHAKVKADFEQCQRDLQIASEPFMALSRKIAEAGVTLQKLKMLDNECAAYRAKRYLEDPKDFDMSYLPPDLRSKCNERDRLNRELGDLRALLPNLLAKKRPFDERVARAKTDLQEASAMLIFAASRSFSEDMRDIIADVGGAARHPLRVSISVGNSTVSQKEHASAWRSLSDEVHRA